jgi:hypothetical protein
MAWVRIEASVPRHWKFQQAGPAASWLWLCGNAYCQDGLTDGFIPVEALPFLGVKGPTPLVKRLLEARLWEACEGGWLVHDYLAHNKPASEIRRIQADRHAAAVNGGKASGEVRRDAKTKRMVEPDGNGLVQPNANQTGNPSTSTASAPSTASSTATATPARVARAPIHVSHKGHAACGRICVPAQLHTEFLLRRNTPEADTELRDWYLAIDRQWLDDPVLAVTEPGDAYDFWRARYAETWPAPALTSGRREPAWLQKARKGSPA